MLEKKSYKDQIVRYLEREIQTGKLLPDTKLKSIRDFSKVFGVSPTTVNFAMDELERRRLIYRKSKQGIFVQNTVLVPDKLEVLLFLFGDNQTLFSLARQVMEISCDSQFFTHVNFYSRVVAINLEKYRDQQFEILRNEIVKLSCMFHPDCCLILGGSFQRKHVEIAMELPYPKLFLGNFTDGDYHDLEYNRIGVAANFFEEAVRCAMKRKRKKIVLLALDQLENVCFFEAARKSAENMAAKSGIFLKTVYLENAKKEDSNLRQRGIVKAVREIRKHSPDFLIFSCISEYREVLGLLPEYANEVVLDSVPEADGDHNPRLLRQESQRDSCEEFKRHIFELLVKVSCKDLNNYREDFVVKRVIQ